MEGKVAVRHKHKMLADNFMDVLNPTMVHNRMNIQDGPGLRATTKF